jgi:tetratricopeptide (TPR) repeat protein
MQSADYGVSEVEVVQALPRRPYPGLRPFTLDEDAIFFGRERMIDEIIDLLAQRCLILVHGSSGSGKSSLVLAGVLPRLARQHRRHGWRWRTASVRPGGGPLWNLASALAELEDDTPSAARVDELRLSFDRTGANLAEIVGQLAGVEQERLCLLVDQFEEIFRYARETSREESRLFVDLVTTVLKEHSTSSVRVILTMRSEFLGECGRLPGLAAVVNTAQYLLPRMETTSLQRAIRRPAELYGGDVTAELADRLIADVRGNQDELPLIQHGLMRLWDLAGEAANDKQAPRRLDLPLYEAHGPLPRLLDRHAEAVAVAAATDDFGRRVVENIFRALTDINADGHAIRRPQALQSLIAVSGTEPGQLVSILDAFRSDGVSFITPYAPASLRNETMIDISHEALVRCWNSLAASPDGWLHREFRDGLIWRSLLSQAEIFEKDQKNVLGPATTEDRQAWLRDRTPAWSERYGGGWSRVQRLMTASRTEAAHDKRLRLRVRRIAISASLIVSSIILSMLLVIIYLQYQNRDQLKSTISAQTEGLQLLMGSLSSAMSSLTAQERRELLNSTTRSAEKLADMVKGQAEYRVILANVFNGLSDFADAAGDWEQAEQTARTAQSFVQPLVNESPDTPDSQRVLFRSAWLLGNALSMEKRTDQAEAEYQHALNIATKLVRLTNGDLRSNRDVAFIENKLGDMCLIRRDTDCALAYYKNALAINQSLLSGLAKDDAVKPDVQRDLAANIIRIGDVYFRQRMLDDALNQYKSAAEIDERLVAVYPNELSIKFVKGVQSDRFCTRATRRFSSRKDFLSKIARPEKKSCPTRTDQRHLAKLSC